MVAYFHVPGVGNITTDPEVVEGGRALEMGHYVEIHGYGIYQKVAAEAGATGFGMGATYVPVDRVPLGAVVMPSRRYHPGIE